MPSSLPPGLGAVFDLDGVLIDSHDQHQRSWFLLAEEEGLPLTPAQFKVSFGMRNDQVIPEVFGWAEPGDAGRIRALGDRKEALYRELLRAEGLEPLPGVIGLLETLREAGVPRAVGSSTSRLNIETCLSLAGLEAYFGDCWSGAEDVSRGKPDPEIFLSAAARIGRQPVACFVVEDAHVGVEAGRRAGMKVIAVTTTHPAESFTGDASPDRVFASLEEVTLGALRELFG